MVEASTPDRPISVVVVVYLYPAGENTTYQGAFLSEFMTGLDNRPHETQVDYTIDEGERPSFVSAAGRVTRTPGNYEFRMALLAEVPGHTDPHQFEQIIPVRVVASRSTGTES